MLEYETDENMVERVRRKFQLHDIALQQPDIGKSVGFDRFPRSLQRDLGEVDRGDVRAGAACRYRDGLRADPASRFQHRGAGGERGIHVQQVDQGRGLILQTLRFLPIVSMHIGTRHRVLPGH